jgi:hypothetical protein
MNSGTLIYSLMLLAFVLPAVAVVILLARSPRPQRFRYWMMRIAAPVMILLFGTIGLSDYLKNGFRWSQLASVVVIATQAFLLWRELPKLRRAALSEGPLPARPFLWPQFRRLWPFTAILAPILLLALMAAWTLRQDRLLAEQEARESAEVLAQRVAQAISSDAVEQLRSYRNVSFSLHANRSADLGLSSWAGGQQTEDQEWERIKAWQQANPEIDLLTLPPAEASSYWESNPETMPPQPAGWLGQLSPEQQQLWQAAKQAESAATDFSGVQTAIQKFIASKPPKGA